jgi:hypothetical protein
MGAVMAHFHEYSPNVQEIIGKFFNLQRNDIQNEKLSVIYAM